MNNPWLFIPKRQPKATSRLFCFHHAGGSASLFYAWPKYFSDDVEIVGIQLPGRGSRIQEDCRTQMESVIDEIEAALLPELDLPFAFFGHSMGGLLAFELARRLEGRGLAPRHLFVSGVRAPPVFHESATRKYGRLNDAELVDDIRHLGGTPAAMLESPELLELFLPIIRSDYRLIDSYRFVGGAPISTPITTLAGLSDGETPEAAILAWKELTTKEFEPRWYPGDHFFVQTQEANVARDIRRRFPEALLS